MSQLPDSNCDEAPGTIKRHLINNREKPPFNNPELRRAMSLRPCRGGAARRNSAGARILVLQPFPATPAPLAALAVPAITAGERHVAKLLDRVPLAANGTLAQIAF